MSAPFRWWLPGLLALVGCVGDLRDGRHADDCVPANSDPLTEQIRKGLAPQCAGCHRVGDIGYFASARAFESLLVRNPRLVKPGKPDESELVLLLEGRRTGSSLTQMPISGEPFAALDAAGKTTLHLSEVRSWIEQLQAPPASRAPDLTLVASQRVEPVHLEFGLRQLLGLDEADFYSVASNYGVPALLERSEDSYDLRSPDRAPAQWSPRGRFVALGGAAATVSSHGDRSISTSFVQTLVPLSQAWCRLAVRKTDNTQLFSIANRSTGLAQRAQVEAQLADWHLLFLAEQPSADEVKTLVDTVFAPLEQSSSVETAWVGTCSYFIRHPLFVFF